LEEELELFKPLAALGEMFSRIAHEIRTPLSKIKTGAEYLKKEMHPTNKALDKMLDAVLNGVDTLNGIVTEILEYTRPIKLIIQDLNIHKVLESSLTALEEEIEDKKIKLDKQYTAEIERVQGDGLKLKQAFVNVIKNALEAMPVGGFLTIMTKVKTEKEGPLPRALEIHFIDTGPGVRPEDQPRVFAPFFTTKDKGTGLGLSIVKKIIDLHHGTVKLISQRGVGTHVIICIPTTPST
jgi:signal transduction histidine kinase